MKHRLPLLALSLAAACASAPSAERADTLVCNGTIYLGAPEWCAVEALALREGRVVAAGALRELEAEAAPNARRIDLRGGFALPGLQDAHGHFEGLGAALEFVDLRGCGSFDEVIARVRARAGKSAAGSWIRGRGWDQNLWDSKQFPTHEALSTAVPSHPVALERVDGHALLANLAAMESAGVWREFASEQVSAGGRVLLDERRRPTGVFVDDACGLIERSIPEPSRATREARFLAAQENLLSFGLTAVHDMGIDREGLEILRDLRRTGRLKLRAVEYLSGSAALVASDLQGFPEPPDELDRLCVIGVKLYADGALGSRGAALLEPYSDEPGHAGLAMMEPEELAHCVAVCAAHGMQPAVHAIGDRANRCALDAFEAQLRQHPEFAALRPRIEHAQVVAPDDWARFEQLGAVASMQPTHATSDMPWAPARLGEARIAGAYAWRRLAPDVSKLAFGSDFPVESPDPLAGLYSAITCARPDGTPPEGFRPDQRLTAREALAAFTSGAARAAHQEDRRGRLLPGYFADLTVLDRDPLVVAPAELKAARVLATVVNGEVVFESR